MPPCAPGLRRVIDLLRISNSGREHGLSIARRWGLRLDIAYGLLALSRIALAAGGEAEARELRARGQRQLTACPDPGFLRGWARAENAVDPLPPPTAADGFDELSERELAVLRLLSSRLSLREIGNELYVSLNTIKTHTRNVYFKLRVSSRQQAVVRARELGLLGRSTATRQ